VAVEKKPRNVQKLSPQPKRSIEGRGDDHPQGLWVNVDFFRKLTKRDPITLLPAQQESTHSRYLELADLVLKGNPRK
jgi:hypothetical protein